MNIFRNEEYILLADDYYGIIYDTNIDFIAITHNVKTITENNNAFKQIEMFEFALNEKYETFLNLVEESVEKKIKEYMYGNKKQKDVFFKKIKDVLFS